MEVNTYLDLKKVIDTFFEMFEKEPPRIFYKNDMLDEWRKRARYKRGDELGDIVFEVDVQKGTYVTEYWLESSAFHLKYWQWLDEEFTQDGKIVITVSFRLEN